MAKSENRFNKYSMLIEKGLVTAKDLAFESLLDDKVIKNGNNSNSLEDDGFIEKVSLSVFQLF
jgi:hypothetical protein